MLIRSRCNFDLLTLKVVVHQASRDENPYKTWAKSNNPGWIIDNFADFCTRYVTLWPWFLTSWPWTSTTVWLSCI